MKALSLHIGLNRIDSAVYGTDGALSGCINDANAMERIADSLKYQTAVLLDEEATAGNVTREIMSAASELSSGDVFLLTYAGHGAQVDDITGDEPDKKDETWCLYDRMLLDDELYFMWGAFNSGVKICVVSDSCHSGTVVRLLLRDMRYDGEGKKRYRLLDDEIAQNVFEKLRSTYEPIKYTYRREVSGAIGASVILMSGCQDGQLSSDGEANGLFTEHLLKIWAEGKFSGNYKSFVKNIVDSIGDPAQIPNYLTVGATNLAFEAQRPFFVGSSTTGNRKSEINDITAELPESNQARKNQEQRTLRETLAIDGDLRRKMQTAAVVAAYGVIKDSGYSITAQDIEETRADQTSIAIAMGMPESRGDNLPEVIIASGIGAAIAAGGF